MSDVAYSLPKAVQRLSRRDPTLKQISLVRKQFTDAQLAVLVDCLLAYTNVVTAVWLGRNRLTDETGVKLARYIAASSTIQLLSLSDNQVGSATYLALAAALRVNSSLRWLYLHGNEAADQTRIEAAFVEALRLNRIRPARTVWWLYVQRQNEYERLKAVAEQLGHPSLQMLLLSRLPKNR